MAIGPVAARSAPFPVFTSAAPTPPDEVTGIAAARPADDVLRRSEVPAGARLAGHVNARGETTGRIVDTTA